MLFLAKVNMPLFPMYWLKIACILPVDWFISKLIIESNTSIFWLVFKSFKSMFKKSRISSFFSLFISKSPSSILPFIFILAFWKAFLIALSIAASLSFTSFSLASGLISLPSISYNASFNWSNVSSPGSNPVSNSKDSLANL